MIAPIIIAVTLIILIFFSQQADLYITKKEKFEIRLSLTIFSYLVDTGEKRQKKKNRKSHLRAKLKSYKYLVRHADVTLKELDPKPPSNTPLGFLSLAPVYALYFSLASYVRANARAFHLEKLNDNEESTVEIKISFVLFHLIIFFLISLYFNLKMKSKKRKKEWQKAR